MHLVPHHSAADLRRILRAEPRAKIVLRLQAVLGALEGETAAALAPRVHLSERSIRFWVARYNAHSLAGLEDQPGRGRPKALTPEQEVRLRQRIRTGATADDGVCTLRGEDVRRILAEEFGVVRGLATTDNLLHSLGFSVLRPRPKHPKTDTATQDAFKKKSRPISPKSPRGTPARPSKSGSKTSAASDRKAR